MKAAAARLGERGVCACFVVCSHAARFHAAASPRQPSNRERGAAFVRSGVSTMATHLEQQQLA